MEHDCVALAVTSQLQIFPSLGALTDNETAQRTTNYCKQCAFCYESLEKPGLVIEASVWFHHYSVE